MLTILAPVLLLAQASTLPAEAAPVPLDIQQQTALRCSMAIAMAAERQRAGTVGDHAWPDLSERGREFFVRSLAQLMDDTGLTREGLVKQARPEVDALQQPGRLAEVMPGCLLLLDASGL
ncbi:hypothetical protein [Erythrobacter mangrovi]|uniref:Uncharacterized protein n=1 Tax=Erythrobacter mangrovi TaxID=2739433 RepID=A0A7D4BA49_9SPHN|nr:hypothetical protein [Erythrobacter mangrovi]QKG70586.1 hypothetical protein HQR01_03940 [Erythrobacter mangrovi]